MQFTTREVKDAWLEAFKKKRTLSAREVNSAFRNNSVYVNEHLSPDNKLMLRQVKEKCKALKIKYAWYRNGKFFVRKSEGENCGRVKSLEDVESVK